MGELPWVAQVDGRTIGTGEKGPMTNRLTKLFRDFVATAGTQVV